MAILSASDLQGSREAKEAEVDDAPKPDVESAIRQAEAKLNLALGYKVANDAESITFVVSSSTDLLWLPERVRSVAAITDTFPGAAAVAVDSYALRAAGFRLYRSAGWREDNTVVVNGEFGFHTDDDEYVLAREFVLNLAVRYLQTTGPDDRMPTPPGAMLTGLASEGAQFTYFTQTGDTSGYGDLDKLLDQIGRHPNKSPGLYTIPVGPASTDLGPERVWLGLETPDDL